MVLPMGPEFQQQITVIENKKEDESIVKTKFYDLCTFSPIIRSE